jgi:hypothetical protein
MKIVRENLYETLNENMQQAKSILKKQGIPETDPRWLQLKQMLLADNKVGYIGKFTKWLFKDREPWEKLTEVYDMLKQHPHKVPPIDTFKTIEDLFDFLQGSEISSKTSKAMKDLKKRLIYFKMDPKQEEKLDKLLELNIKYVDQIRDYYNKKGRKFKNFSDLYDETESLIKNLSGGFNLQSMKKKIKETNSDVEIMLERPDLLVLRPKNYQSSCALGSNSWCISYSKNYWDSYVDVFSNQYFIYDFSKPLSDKRSMIGVTVNPDGSFKAAHFKDDSVCSHDYLEKLLED